MLLDGVLHLFTLPVVFYKSLTGLSVSSVYIVVCVIVEFIYTED